MTSLHLIDARRLCLGALLLTLACTANAAGLRERLQARFAQQGQQTADDSQSGSTLPAGVRVVRDVPYGRDPEQRFDVYLPRRAEGAPVIFMVHGGGWKRGDKAEKAVVDNKVARWVPKGFILVSTNYRLLPKQGPIDQAADVARALAAAQNHAAAWGADRSKFILMGHSAGAHLVSLLASSPSIALQQGASPWLGTVSLDHDAFDVVQTMESRHLSLYDGAFGTDPAYWKAASPIHVLAGSGTPFLAVCSTRRPDPCPQAKEYTAKAAAFGTWTQVLEQDKSHREINLELGLESDYTRTVEAFLSILDKSVARLLSERFNR